MVPWAADCCSCLREENITGDGSLLRACLREGEEQRGRRNGGRRRWGILGKWREFQKMGREVRYLLMAVRARVRLMGFRFGLLILG